MPEQSALQLTSDSEKMAGELIVFITVPSQEVARKIAEALVSELLAACVNIVPNIESIYRWEGRIATDSELLLMVKTTVENYSDLEARVKALHTYSTPEVLAIRVD